MTEVAFFKKLLAEHRLIKHGTSSPTGIVERSFAKIFKFLVVGAIAEALISATPSFPSGATAVGDRGYDGQNAEAFKRRYPQRAPLQLQQLAECFWIGHRRFAGEIFAHIRGCFPINRRHRANGFVFPAEKFLAFSSIGEKNNCVWQKMMMHLFKKRFRFGRVLLTGDHDLPRLA
jgi:hypothetical protein